MKFLFVLDSVENPTAANPRLGRVLGAALAKRGHQVHLLELWDGHNPPPHLSGLTAHPLAFADEYQMNRALENGAKQGSPLPLRLARLALHPTGVAAAFRQLVLHKPRRTEESRRAIERLDRMEHFDWVVAVAAPYRAAFALETAQIGGRKALWQLDPYGGNRDYQAPGGYAREAQLLTALDAAFITAQAVPDYADGAPLAAMRGKVTALGFPCLQPVPAVGPVSDPPRCVFCGSLYPGLREPRYALRLFRELNDPTLQLHFAGNGWQPFADDAQAAEAVLGQRLVRHGPVPAAEATALQQSAAVLLSLGNTVDNQLPSKLFEYFALGKPILHLCATPGDPALPYLQRYPLALVLHESTPTAETVPTLRRWLTEVRDRQVPYETVTTLYPEFTADGVAEAFLAGLPA